MEELEGKSIADHLAYTKNKMKTILKREQELLEKRNRHIVSIIKKYPGKTIALVIGHRHTPGLTKLLEAEKITVHTPPLINRSLPKSDLFQRLEAILR